MPEEFDEDVFVIETLGAGDFGKVSARFGSTVVKVVIAIFYSNKQRF